MANKTIDRRKAGLARSQAAKATSQLKPKPARPGADKGADQSDLKLEKTARGGKAETLEVEESETEELALDEETEEGSEVVDEVEAEEEEEAGDDDTDEQEEEETASAAEEPGAEETGDEEEA